MKKTFFLFLFLSIGTVSVQSESDPIPKILQYAIFKKIDLNQLVEGKIISERVSLPQAPLGMSVETCYLLPLTPQKVLEKMRDDRSSVDVQASDTLDKQGHFQVSIPVKDSDFIALKLDPQQSPIRTFLKKMGDLAEPTHGLNLSHPETENLHQTYQEIIATDSKNWLKTENETLTEAWRTLLKKRVQQFQTDGLTTALPYENRNPKFELKTELARLFANRSTIFNRFSNLFSMSYGRAKSNVTPRYYWEQSKIQGEMTYNLGAFFDTPYENSLQALELQYYVSSKYFEALILYELFPLESDGKIQTLVWRGDYVLSPYITFLKGIERLASENIFSLEVKKSIQAFIKECKE